MTVRLPLLTASRLKAFRRCARLHHLRYVLGYRVVDQAAALRFGTLVHLALQRWWEAHLPAERRAAIARAIAKTAEEAGRPLTEAEAALAAALEAGDALAAALSAVAAVSAGARYEGAAFDRAKAGLLVEGYHHRWADTDLEALEVEAEFRVPLTNPATGAASRSFLLGGKIDAIARERRTGRIFVVEHKTASESFEDGSVYRARLKLNNQVSVYFRGAEALGYAPAACLYDVVGKPAIRPLKATPAAQRKYTRERLDRSGNVVEPARLYANQREADETPEEYAVRLRDAIAGAPEQYFARFEVVRLDDEIAEHAADLWQTARAVRAAERAGHAPKNDDGCFAYGRACEFLPACTREASLDDRSRYVRTGDVHPELSGG
jgi:hypothetical protein